MRINIMSCQLVKEKGVNYKVNADIHSPESAVDICRDVLELHTRAEERIYALCLNTIGKINGIFQISQGTAGESHTHPREVFKGAILHNANSIILAHNHPAGSTSPSSSDIKMTENIIKASKIIGIQLSDHIIVTRDDYYSMKANRPEIFDK